MPPLQEDLDALPELRARVTRLEIAVMTLANMAAPLYPLDDIKGVLRKILTGPSPVDRAILGAPAPAARESESTDDAA